MTGLAIVLGIIAVIFTVLMIAVRCTRSRRWRSPSGLFGGTVTDVDWPLTIFAKLACFVVALLSGYACGYFMGWWS
jgi:uncharacterized membrane protein